MLQLLINAGVNVNVRANIYPYYTALMESTYMFDSIGLEHNVAVDMLINAGAYLNETTQNGTTALHLCCQSYRTEASARSLIDAGANLDIVNYYGTVLHSSLLHGCNSITRHLIKNDINVDIPNYCGDTVLIECCTSYCEEDIFKLIVDKSKNLDIQGELGQTALIRCAYYSNNIERIRYLLQKGANFNIKDDNGYTALMMANKYDCTEIAKMLNICSNSIFSLNG